MLRPRGREFFVDASSFSIFSEQRRCSVPGSTERKGVSSKGKETVEESIFHGRSGRYDRRIGKPGKSKHERRLGRNTEFKIEPNIEVTGSRSYRGPKNFKARGRFGAKRSPGTFETHWSIDNDVYGEFRISRIRRLKGKKRKTRAEFPRLKMRLAVLPARIVRESSRILIGNAVRAKRTHGPVDAERRGEFTDSGMLLLN